MKDIKVPQRLKGFNDYFADDVMIRRYVTDIIRSTYEKYGFEPLETPALEYSELILGQSGEEAEKLYYRFQDPGQRDVMLRYEVMISMCRAVAQNTNNIQFPYKRYQIQNVWRAENTQKGRYREFTQCDADIVGTDSMLADAEVIQMGIEILSKLGFKEFRAVINNRKILDGLVEYLGIDKDKSYGVYMSLDKLKKIGIQKVYEELVDRRGIEEDKAKKILDIISISDLDKLNDSIGSTKVGREGIEELKEIFKYLKSMDVNTSNYVFDISLARGLASYTGPVWEYEVIDGGLGSVGGCGRYDKAIEKYIGINMPATGGSFGLERLCDIIKDRNMVKFGKTTTSVLITNIDNNLVDEYISLGNMLRENSINTMIYPQTEKLGKQLKYADRKGIRYVLIVGQDEKEKNLIQLKDMINESSFLIKKEDLIQKISV